MSNLANAFGKLTLIAVMRIIIDIAQTALLLLCTYVVFQSTHGLGIRVCSKCTNLNHSTHPILGLSMSTITNKEDNV